MGWQRVRHNWAISTFHTQFIVARHSNYLPSTTLLTCSYLHLICFNWASLMAQLVKNLPAMWETRVRSLGWEDPLEKGKGHPLQYSGLENSMDCTACGVAKSQTPLSDFYFHFCFSYWFCIFTLPLLIHGNHFDSHPALLDKQVFFIKALYRWNSAASLTAKNDPYEVYYLLCFIVAVTDKALKLSYPSKA